ncbi:MAG: hypothetical protein M3292_09970, partial [Actinomycetota bacterium]|nr:hypothetical protein [Actinomycetota bacterium]
ASGSERREQTFRRLTTAIAAIAAAAVLVSGAGASVVSDAKAVLALAKNTPGSRAAIYRGAPGGLTVYG